MSGDHAKVAAWRDAQSLERTRAAEARDRQAWIEREALIATREASIRELERLQAEKDERKARKRKRKE